MVQMPLWLHLGFKTCTVDTRTYVGIKASLMRKTDVLGTISCSAASSTTTKTRGKAKSLNAEESYMYRVQFTRCGHSSQSLPTRSPGQRCRTSSASA